MVSFHKGQEKRRLCRLMPGVFRPPAERRGRGINSASRTVTVIRMLFRMTGAERGAAPRRGCPFPPPRIFGRSLFRPAAGYSCSPAPLFTHLFYHMRAQKSKIFGAPRILFEIFTVFPLKKSRICSTIYPSGVSERPDLSGTSPERPRKDIGVIAHGTGKKGAYRPHVRR